MKSGVLSVVALALTIVTSTTVSAQQLKPQAETKTEMDWAVWNGVWKPVNGKLGGQEFPKTQLEPMKLTIKDGSYVFQMPGLTEKGKLVVGEPTEEGKPRTLNVIIDEGPNQGKTVPAIYRFENDTLIVCYAVDNQRPTEFQSDASNSNLLLEYEKLDDK